MGDARLEPARPDRRQPSWLEPGKRPKAPRSALPWIMALLAISLVAVAAFLLGRGSEPRLIPPPVTPLPSASDPATARRVVTPEPGRIAAATVEAPALARAAQEIERDQRQQYL